MLSSVHQSLPKMSANTAATGTNGIAVALAEHFAALVPFRWLQANLPPAQNANSAVFPLPPACHFGGKYAITAQIALTTVTQMPTTFTRNLIFVGARIYPARADQPQSTRLWSAFSALVLWLAARHQRGKHIRF